MHVAASFSFSLLLIYYLNDNTINCIDKIQHHQHKAFVVFFPFLLVSAVGGSKQEERCETFFFKFQTCVQLVCDARSIENGDERAAKTAKKKQQ